MIKSGQHDVQAYHANCQGVVSMSIMRDPYSQANVGNTRYLARRRVGGAVVNAEAIRLQNVSA